MTRLPLLCLLLSGCYLQDRTVYESHGVRTVMVTEQTMAAMTRAAHITAPDGYAVDAFWTSMSSETWFRSHQPEATETHIFLLSTSTNRVEMVDARRLP